MGPFAGEDLRARSQVEEQLLLAAWAPQGSSEETEPTRLRSEQAEILRLVATVASSSEPDRQAALDRFATALERHVRWQEPSLLPDRTGAERGRGCRSRLEPSADQRSRVVQPLPQK